MNEAHERCDGCKHDLGGGRDNCRLNLSYECRDGGGFEAWEDSVKTNTADEYDTSVSGRSDD